MEKYGCKGAYAQYLITLAKYPEGLSLAKLSDICDKDKSAVSRYIFEMQEKNLVTKENKTSGKYNARITLTNDGYRAYEYIHTRAMEIVRDAGKDISDENRQILYDLLDKIYASLTEIANKNYTDSSDFIITGELI
jgi:DNA-binding MarR family transcriptional regulator